ncbi:hypothetical protein AWB65_06770 [Caballeronia humi]|uniref:Uncharacterized protein n=1 Tax=Caballeronia humi TaxID=326474 RepID=A0A158JKE7_9BURK|nr:hypothetical protein AWB65_06770 [Caballeronia humi]
MCGHAESYQQDNCQVAVSLSVAYQLYLPQEMGR